MEFKAKNTKVNKVEDEVDVLFESRPMELKKIRDNKKFISEIEKDPLPVKVASIPVFGTSVDFNAILKDNIWNRSTYIVDMLCDMFLHMDIERKKKYLAKKRKMPMNMIWLIIVMIAAGIGIIVMLLVLGVV